jgi:hypothetical protein
MWIKVTSSNCVVAFAWLASLWATSLTARGEVTRTGSDDNGLTIVHLAVTPAAEPSPVMKYRLMPRDIDLRPGNAAPYYYRALLETRTTMDRLRKEFGDEYDEWYYGDPHIPTSQLPLAKLRKADGYAASALEGPVTEATARRSCDWQLELDQLRGADVIAFHLTEFQQLRDLARMLAIRARLAIAEGRYDDALRALRMNFRVAVDTGNEPLIVCGLIGIAIAGVNDDALAELIAAPNSPNLYWALTELPQPLVDLRPADRFESDIGARVFPLIHNAETTDRSPEEWNRLVKQTVRDMAGQDTEYFRGLDPLGADLSATGFALIGYSLAKEHLIAEGMDRNKVEAMAVGQVLAIYSERVYERHANEFETLWYVPFWEMDRRYRDAEGKLNDARPLWGGADRELFPFAMSLLPAMQAARTAQVKQDRDIAAFRVIEALRMYAADHAGSLPAKLDEIRAVPVPLNPATGKPFVYRLDGKVAVLELPLSDGIPGVNRRYEITIAAKDK